jgi:hypothetical protein
MTPEEFSRAIHASIAVTVGEGAATWEELDAEDMADLMAMSTHFLTLYLVTPIDPTKGCWMDDGEGVPLPDTCVIDDGKPEDCIYAKGKMSRAECEYWKTPTNMVKP